MDLGLKDKGVIVMASSSGLGKAVATEFAREQAKVMLFSPFEDQLKEAQADIKAETGYEPEIFIGDITKAEDIKQLVATTVEKFGGIYALVNNTGGPPAGTFDAFDDEAWQKAYELTLLSYIRAVREVLPHMRAAGGGRILCSTSSSIKAVLDNLILSNTFRSGVVGLAKTLSQEFGKDGILVNVIAPGRIGTARIDQLDALRAEKTGVSVEQLQQNTYKTIPLGRYGEPAEYGKLSAFLCSAANTYITGQSVLVDGGLVKAL
ncbi:MAG: SDR family oxidoreductase [Desulfuromusa sp.]|nr:SDR family oxidoreductase [Desulfuromusa sp.]